MAAINILCAFCGNPLDEDSLEIYAEASIGCDTCGPETEIDTNIYCRNPNCTKYNMVIYTKSAD